MKIVWDDPLERFYDVGVSQGVLYTENAPAVAWNGLISVTESPEQTQDPRYFDGVRYATRSLSTPFAGTISAYTYPDELAPCIGNVGILTTQTRSPFSFSFRTNREIHLVYNAMTAPSKRNYKTLGQTPDPLAFEWTFTTQPEKIPGGKPSAHLVIVVDDAPPGAIDDLEAFIYGDDENDPSLPAIEDILEIFESNAIMRVTDHGDGTYTIEGPDTMVSMVDADTFRIDAASVIFLDSDTFQVSTM